MLSLFAKGSKFAKGPKKFALENFYLLRIKLCLLIKTNNSQRLF